MTHDESGLRIEVKCEYINWLLIDPSKGFKSSPLINGVLYSINVGNIDF